MHHQSQLANLVDVLAVDFNIVDRLGDSRKGDAQNYRKSIEALEPLVSSPAPIGTDSMGT
jgi:hypothetical protein